MISDKRYKIFQSELDNNIIELRVNIIDRELSE